MKPADLQGPPSDPDFYRRQINRAVAPAAPLAAQPTIEAHAPTRRAPTATEARYRRERLAGARAHYEGLTFRLANGHAYKPDWVVVQDGGQIECHEVKGSYKLPSHGRARLAFDQAAVEWPCFRWVWATLTEDGEWVTETKGGAAE
jgi:hypothetical protein